MSRKTQMSMWKDGHRRSPRISALDAWKAHKEKDGSVNVPQNSIQVMPMEHNGLGPPSRTRARKKRKLRPVQDVAVSSVTTTANQGSESPVDEDHPVNSDQQSVFQAKESTKHEDGESSIMSSAEWLPEKHILELILDTLQRRDTHEIFAEPVDPEEVEDYYEIIKEPMDFGTMRAKLHEGMYNNLEQFEHDAFLISSNAMHFNSSSTIYFRQARALQELAKKVFHVLKTDRGNFELEFSATRRRPSRRPPADARGSNFSSPAKPMTNARARSMVYDGSSSKGIRSLSSPLSLRKTVRVNPGFPDNAAAHFEAGDPEILSGYGDGKSNLSETEQRCSYRPWTSFLDENEPIVSTIYSYPRALFRVNQSDKGYTESLMMFVKDLGPVAQTVAKKKLQGWWPEEPDRRNSSSNHRFRSPKPENPAAGILDIAKNTTRTENSLNNRMSFPFPVGLRGNAVHQKRNAEIQVTGKSDMFEKFSGSAQAGPVMGLNQSKPVVSQFIFDMPFLRSQLSQMNSPGQTGMQRSSTADHGQFSGKISHERASLSSQPSSQQHTLLDSKPNDLVLQL